MQEEKTNDDCALILPLEDYLMLHYVAAQEGTTPANLVKRLFLGYLDAKKNETGK